MKTKIPILIAAGLFLATVSKAQYGSPYHDSRIVIQGRIVIPGPAVVAYNYNNLSRERYDDRRNDRDDYARYHDRRDWREVEYDRYCRENRRHPMSREQFYRERCDYRFNPNCGPRKVVVYR